MSVDRVTVVGGGAIGLSIAWELARRGIAVKLLERDQVGRATSWSGAGILPPANFDQATDPIDRLRGVSHQLFPTWMEQLQELTGIDCGFRRCGGWYLTESNGEQAAMMGMVGYWDELGIACEQVSPTELARREPCLASWASQPGRNAWWTPDECQIRPPRYLQALAAACELAGVEIIEQAAVTDIRSTADGNEVFANDKWQPSNQVVLCGGAWSGLIAESMRMRQSIVPVRGQILLLKTPTPLLNGIANLGHRYILCRDDGYTLIGSCEEEVGFELGTTDPMIESLFDFGVGVIPELNSAQRIKSWSGLRPMTFDGFPMIGRVPGSNGLYVATGHFRSGLHLSPATATILADEITGQPTVLSLDHFRVGKQLSQEA